MIDAQSVAQAGQQGGHEWQVAVGQGRPGGCQPVENFVAIEVQPEAEQQLQQQEYQFMLGRV